MRILEESEVREGIKNILNKFDFLNIPYPGSMYGRNGTSDILGCGNLHDGRFIAIECKRSDWKPPRPPKPGKPPTKAWKKHLEQVEFIEDVNRHGGIGFFATSTETVIKALELPVLL